MPYEALYMIAREMIKKSLSYPRKFASNGIRNEESIKQTHAIKSLELNRMTVHVHESYR